MRCHLGVLAGRRSISKRPFSLPPQIARRRRLPPESQTHIGGSGTAPSGYVRAVCTAARCEPARSELTSSDARATAKWSAEFLAAAHAYLSGAPKGICGGRSFESSVCACVAFRCDKVALRVARQTHINGFTICTRPARNGCNQTRLSRAARRSPTSVVDASLGVRVRSYARAPSARSLLVHRLQFGASVCVCARALGRSVCVCSHWLAARVH